MIKKESGENQKNIFLGENDPGIYSVSSKGNNNKVVLNKQFLQVVRIMTIVQLGVSRLIKSHMIELIKIYITECNIEYL